MRWSDALAPASPRPARISRQDAWQPMAVMSFDDPATHKSPAQRAEEAARQAEQELTRQLEASWQSGHQAGLAEATERQRQEEAQHGMTVRARAGSLLADFSSGLDALKEGLAHEVMTLAMQLAERIACEQIRISKDALAPVLADSMKHVSERYRHLEASVHPDDVETAQQWFAANHPEIAVKVLASGKVARGGCTLAAGSTRVDSQLETRVARAFAALGLDDERNGARRENARADDASPARPTEPPPMDGTASESLVADAVDTHVEEAALPAQDAAPIVSATG